MENLSIIFLSLFISITSTFIASIIGFLLAIPIGLKNFSFKKYIIRISGTLMSIPPVLMGLVVYLILSRSGPLGNFRLLFTPTAMIIAQTLLVLPIIFGLTISTIGKLGKDVELNCIALGADRKDTLFTIIKECRYQLVTVVAVGFGRAISEVGAVMMVGGNIKGQTRVMTTYIAMETGKGNFTEAVIIGVVLLVVSFFVNYILHSFDKMGE